MMPEVSDLTAKMSKTLDCVLDPIRSSSQFVTWQFSSLNKNGFPLEFSFSSHEEGFRYTIEVAPSEVPASERLSRTVNLLATLRA